MQPDTSILNDLVQRILKVTNPSRVLLFGSAARGNMRADSDLDVLVIVSSGCNRREIARKIYRNLIGFSYAVDIIVATEDDLQHYGDKAGLVYYPALREGKELYAA